MTSNDCIHSLKHIKEREFLQKFYKGLIDFRGFLFLFPSQIRNYSLRVSKFGQYLHLSSDENSSRPQDRMFTFFYKTKSQHYSL